MKLPSESSLRSLAKWARDDAKHHAHFQPAIKTDGTRFGVQVRTYRFDRQARAVLLDASQSEIVERQRDGSFKIVPTSSRKLNTMKTEFSSIIPRLVQRMDGRSMIPRHIELWLERLESERLAAGDAVDFAICAAFEQAERQGEDLNEVLNHIEYITDQLGIFRANLEAEVSALEMTIARETHIAKTA